MAPYPHRQVEGFSSVLKVALRLLLFVSSPAVPCVSTTGVSGRTAVLDMSQNTGTQIPADGHVTLGYARTNGMILETLASSRAGAPRDIIP